MRRARRQAQICALWQNCITWLGYSIPPPPSVILYSRIENTERLSRGRVLAAPLANSECHLEFGIGIRLTLSPFSILHP